VRFQHFNEFLCCHCFNLFQFRFLSNHDNTTQSCSSFYWCNCNFSFCDVMKYCNVWIHICVTNPNPKNANPKRQQIQNDDGELYNSFPIHWRSYFSGVHQPPFSMPPIPPMTTT
jgi:hypothetical protein